MARPGDYHELYLVGAGRTPVLLLAYLSDDQLVDYLTHHILVDLRCYSPMPRVALVTALKRVASVFVHELDAIRRPT